MSSTVIGPILVLRLHIQRSGVLRNPQLTFNPGKNDKVGRRHNFIPFLDHKVFVHYISTPSYNGLAAGCGSFKGETHRKSGYRDLQISCAVTSQGSTIIDFAVRRCGQGQYGREYSQQTRNRILVCIPSRHILGSRTDAIYYLITKSIRIIILIGNTVKRGCNVHIMAGGTYQNNCIGGVLCDCISAELHGVASIGMRKAIVIEVRISGADHHLCSHAVNAQLAKNRVSCTRITSIVLQHVCERIVHQIFRRHGNGSRWRDGQFVTGR